MILSGMGMAAPGCFTSKSQVPFPQTSVFFGRQLGLGRCGAVLVPRTNPSIGGRREYSGKCQASLNSQKHSEPGTWPNRARCVFRPCWSAKCCKEQKENKSILRGMLPPFFMPWRRSAELVAVIARWQNGSLDFTAGCPHQGFPIQCLSLYRTHDARRQSLSPCLTSVLECSQAACESATLVDQHYLGL